MDRVVIYGLGRNYKKHRAVLERKYHIVGYCDSNGAGHADLPLGREGTFIPPDRLAETSFDYILVTTSLYAAEVIESLDRLGIGKEQVRVFPWEKECYSFWGTEPLKGVSYSGGADYLVDVLRDRLRIPYGEMRYIDLGVCNPVGGDNTYYFYERGAAGILVEANPDVIGNIIEKRCRDTVLNRAVYVGGEPEATFYISKEAGLSSLVKEHVEDNPGWAEYPVVREAVVPTIHINEIFALLGEGDVCDFLSIDIEGYDLEALQALDFGRYRPKIIAAELTAGYVEKYDYYQGIVDLLLGRGYLLYANDEYNGIFVDGKYLSLL